MLCLILATFRKIKNESYVSNVTKNILIDVMRKLLFFTHNTILAVFEIKGAPCVHILAAGCMQFETCAPGVCMLFPNFK